MKRKKLRMALILISIAILIAVIFVMVLKLYENTRLKEISKGSLELPGKPSKVHVAPDPQCTVLYAVINGDVYLCSIQNIEGDIRDRRYGLTYEKINIPFKVHDAIFLNNLCTEMLLIDLNRNLYEFDIDSNKLSDILLTNVDTVSSSPSRFSAITKDGKLYMWGKNTAGELGLDTNKDIEKPTLIDYVDDVKKVVTYSSYTFLLTENGDVYEAGVISPDNISHKFLKVADFKNIKNIGQAGNENFVVCGDGTVYMSHHGFTDNTSHIVDEFTKKGIDTFPEYNYGFSHVGINSKNKKVYYWGKDILNWENIRDNKEIEIPAEIRGIRNYDGIYVEFDVIFMLKRNILYII